MDIERLTTIAGLSALVLVFGSCGALKRVHECEEVVDSVNASREQLETEVPDAGSSFESYARIAAVYEDLVKRIDEVQVEDVALGRALASYKEVAERAAKHSRSFSAELATVAKSRSDRKNKEVRLNRIRTLAKGDLAREASVIRKVNALCHPH